MESIASYYPISHVLRVNLSTAKGMTAEITFESSNLFIELVGVRGPKILMDMFDSCAIDEIRFYPRRGRKDQLEIGRFVFAFRIDEEPFKEVLIEDFMVVEM